MAFPDNRLVIDDPRMAEWDMATEEVDAGCEIRILADAPLGRFMPGCDREREETRALQEFRRRRGGLSENTTR